MTWQKVQRWQRLPGVLRPAPDPYLIWAGLTDWADFRGAARVPHAASLLIELKSDKDITKFRAAFRRLVGERGLIPGVYRSGRYLTAWLPIDLLGEFADDRDRKGTGQYLGRFDLCLPIVPGRPAAHPDRTLFPPLRGTVLIGVIDAGCPFGRADLISIENGSPSSRIAALWDMNHHHTGFMGRSRAKAPLKMGYGAEAWRRAVKSGPPGIDDQIARFVSPTGDVEEAACYADARMHSLTGQISHGAHVLGVLVGPVSLRNRICLVGDAPPSWAPKGDAASDPSRTDIAFVQLPSSALQDASGGWLGSHVLDAVSYVRDVAGKATERVVINLSYGCTVGPHDGTSLLECAIAAIGADSLTVASPPGGPRTQARPKVEIVIAAGNSFNADGHAVLGRGAQGPIVWRLLPGSEAPSFVQLWFPKEVDASSARVLITPPNGSVVEVGIDEVFVWPKRRRPSVGAIFLRKHSRGADSAMLLLAVGPTESIDGKRATAPHGDWTIDVKWDKLDVYEVDAYVARNDPDIGVALRGRQSFFVDYFEPLRYLRRFIDDDGKILDDCIERGDESGRKPSVLRRRGTLNGIGCGAGSVSVAGYELRRGTHALYSSAGRAESPSRGTSPESACVTDESSGLTGVRAAGNVGASVFRMIGTSTAAPQRARQLVNGESIAQPMPSRGESDPVNPGDLWGALRRPPELQ